MQKTFCDICGNQVDGKGMANMSIRPNAGDPQKDFQVSVVIQAHSFGPAARDAELCQGCFRKVVQAAFKEAANG